MSLRDLRKLYSGIYSEDVSVTFETDDGTVQSYRLQDSYAKVIQRRIQADSGNAVDKSIDAIYRNSGWIGSKQGHSKNVFKDIILNSSYDLSIELVKYIAEEKETLLALTGFSVGKVKNFTDLIKSKLPQEYVRPGLDEFIKQVHFNVIPKAATNVGMGEGTFTIFGTAKKGTSGDLSWNDFEVEVKTGGADNTGAILGGDGYLNKISDRLKRSTEYVHLKVNDINMLEQALKKATTAVATKGDAAFDQFKDLYRRKRVFKSEKLNDAILRSTLHNFMNQQVTKDFKPVSRPSPHGGMTLHTSLMEKLDEERQRSSKLGTNLSSQIASYLTDDSSVEDFVNVFSEARTYASTSINFKKQLRDFFRTRDYKEFSPKNDYDNFARLMGAIALVSYKENNGFDLMLVLNDPKTTGVIINCRSGSIESVYNQLERVPEVQFDLSIDVYEGGKFKSQTVIAKSPRIKLV